MSKSFLGSQALVSMVYLLPIVGWLFLMPVKVLANDDVPLREDSLSHGIWLTEPPFSWRFSPGDDPAWADPHYDDRTWLHVNPAQLDSLPEAQWPGIGWFRLHFRLDSPADSQMLALWLDHYGASQIYLNGKLLHQWGRVGATPETEQAYQPHNQLLMLLLGNQPPHCIAIRYSNHRPLRLFPLGFQARLARAESAIAQAQMQARQESGINLPMVGVLAAFALLHGLLFAFNTTQRANFFYSLCMAGFAYTYLAFYIKTISTDPIRLLREDVLFTFAQLISLVACQAFFYSIEKRQLPKRLWLSAGWLLVSIPAILLYPETPRQYWLVPLAVGCGLEILRILIQSLWKGQNSVWIIGVGVILAMITFFVVYVDVFSLWSSESLSKAIAIDIGFLCLPIATSIYLARDFARTSRDLQVQLDQVEKLSYQTRMQQVEKTKLLEQQQQVLEKTVRERTQEISEQNRMLQQQKEEITGQAQRLQELDDVKTRFFTNITHEFRTPLTLMIGPAEEILARSREEDSQRHARQIKHSAQQLLRLINQLLDLSRLEAGELTLNLTRGDFLLLVKGICYAFDSLAKQKHIRLLFSSGLPALEMDFDPDQLEKVLHNLLSNAFKFTRPGGMVRVQIEGDYSGEVPVAQLSVEDTGIGIAVQHLPFLFDRFYQVDPSATREGEGTGVGLSLVKELVELHGGQVSVTSQPAVGTNFTIRLPMRQTRQPAPGIEQPASVAAPSHLTVPVFPQMSEVQDSEDVISDMDERLLLIEDHPEVRQFISNCLRDDYRISQAAEGQQGLAMAFEQIPDIVITDLMMPLLDGVTLCRQLKTDIRTSHIPVLMLTAKADIESKLQGLETGADAYLSKPFHVRELRLTVRNLLESRRKIRERYRAEYHNGHTIDVSTIYPSSESVFLEQVHVLVEQHLEEEGFGVDQLSREVGLSRSQLHRKLKALTGQAAGDFIRERRLRRAFELLQSRAATVSEVAYRVGFSSPSNFSAAFSRHFGYPPSQVPTR